jgi:phage/plasmid-like protein (TIGR03299 family)
MAHQVETMAYAGEVPWHGLGVPVSNDLTPTQMMEKAGVDWNVREVESFIEFDGKRMPTGQKSLVRETDGRILTNVGENWNPVQNSEAFDFFAEYVNVGDMEMHTAGSLKDGQIVWALAKVKDSFELFDGDRVDSYLLFSNPHQYGKSIDIRFTPIRVVCNNTLTFALDSMSDRQVKVGHRTIFDASSVKETLGIATDTMQKYKEVASFLGSKRFTQDTYIEYLNTVFPRTSDKRIKSGMDKIEQMSRNAKLCYDALEQQPGAEYAEGSWWQAFNSVTFITDHVQGRNQENRLANSWFGYNQTRKREALKSAIEFAEAA